MKNRLFIAVIAALSLCTGCKPIQLESQWRDRDITIDGSTAEWSGLIQYPEDSKIGIGIVNDEAYLYLCLTSEDRAIASQILMSGFTVLFESKARKGKRFGVHFPLGMKLFGPPSEEAGDREPDMAAMTARMEASLQTLALLGPGKNDTLPMSTRIAESLGIAVCIKPSRENCAYELKVLLNPDSLFRYALGIGKDTLLAVTLETDRTDRASRPSGGHHGGGGGMGPHGGGMGGGGRMGSHGGGGGRMGPPGGGPPSMPEQFKMEFSINLTKK